MQVKLWPILLLAGVRNIMNLVYVYFSVTQNAHLIITDTQRHGLEKMITDYLNESTGNLVK